MTRSIFLSAAVSLALSISSAGSVASEPNAAFDEQFIWAISSELAEDLSRTLNLRIYDLEPELIEDQQKFFEILYFNELISCSTPLTRLTTVLAAVKLPQADTISGVASPEIRHALKDHRQSIESEINAWNKTARARVVKTFLANSWSISPPACIHPQALQQIPALRPTPK